MVKRGDINFTMSHTVKCGPWQWILSTMYFFVFAVTWKDYWLLDYYYFSCIVLIDEYLWIDSLIHIGQIQF